jgi:predicted nucleic acid-binding protein
MTLTDAGVLIAMIDPGEPRHAGVVASLQSIRLPMTTTWPAFAEAMHLLYGRTGAPGRDALWRLVTSQRLVIADLSNAAVARCQALMEKYADRPMDLADATLVALAEERNERQIFTVDSNFAVYRLHGRTRFELIPG